MYLHPHQGRTHAPRLVHTRHGKKGVRIKEKRGRDHEACGVEAWPGLPPCDVPGGHEKLHDLHTPFGPAASHTQA